MTVSGSFTDFIFNDETKFGQNYKNRCKAKNKQEDQLEPLVTFKMIMYPQSMIDNNVNDSAKSAESDSDKIRVDHEFSFEAKLNPVILTHTARFQNELLVYSYHMSQLLEIAARGYNQGLNPIAARGSRIKIKIDLVKPVMILPESAYSENLILMDLGMIKIRNKFVFSEPDEIHKISVLYDNVSVKMTDMVVYCSAKGNIDHQDDDKQTHARVTDELFNMNIKILRNLDSAIAKPVPDMKMIVSFNNAKFKLDKTQYWLFRSFVIHNLSEPLPEFVRPDFNMKRKFNFQNIVNIVKANNALNLKRFGLWPTMYTQIIMNDVVIEIGIETNEEHILMPQVQYFFEKDCTFESITLSDKSNEMRLSCKSFKCKNVQDLSRPKKFQKILFSKSELEEYEFKFKYEYTRENIMLIDVYLNNMIVNLDPLWMKTTHILMTENPFEIEHNFLKQKSQNLLEEMKQKPVTALQYTEHTPKIKLNFKSEKSEFNLIEDFKTEQTNSIILKTSFMLKLNQLKNAEEYLNFEVSDLSIDSVSNFRTVHLVESFAMLVSIKKTEDVMHTHNFKVNATKDVILRMTYQDAMMCYRILQTFQQGLEEFNENQEDTPKTVVHSLESTKNDVRERFKRQMSHYRKSENDETEMEITGGAVQFSSVSFTFVDDCGDANVPLLV